MLVLIKYINIYQIFEFQNAWVKEEIDTRNVGVHEVIVEVEDLPDTPPYFLIAPPVTRLPETATIVSDLLIRILAVFFQKCLTVTPATTRRFEAN